ncbi:hypothetical protein L6452_43891 [Arctium lappa]|uniref:Uncharacterized protein n=1 Tax=Arctium lappa TaxID=4217 RepID=A0ACB8XE99_ARCLA|nr:hypothetical protein L6452_43891 [Arctium lappa]
MLGNMSSKRGGRSSGYQGGKSSNKGWNMNPNSPGGYFTMTESGFGNMSPVESYDGPIYGKPVGPEFNKVSGM